MKKTVFTFCMLVLNYFVHASTIPQYKITSNENGQIKLSNGAVFQTQLANWFLLTHWFPEDFVAIEYRSDEFYSHEMRIVDGKEIHDAFLTFHNLERNSYIPFYLIAPGSSDSPDTGKIARIDAADRRIALMDGSIWLWPTESLSEILQWHEGDVVMIGRNGQMLSNFDAIMFNMDKQSVVPALEQ